MTCVCTLDVSRALVRFVAGLLAAERRRVGTRRGTRRLTPFHRARFALACLRDRVEVEWLGAGFGLSRATACRYLEEVVRVLSDQAPELHEALERAAEDEMPRLILDGTVIAAGRLSETKISRKGRGIDSWYSGRTQGFGGNIRALMASNGIPLWVSDVLPGSTHGLTGAREPVLAALWPYAETMPVLADGGYEDARRGPDPGAPTRRRHPPARRPAHLQQALERISMPRRARLRPTRRTSASPAPRHRESEKNHRPRPRRPRSDPLRTRLDQLILAEITSMRSFLCEAAEPLIHYAPARERFAFVHARRGRFSVNRLC